MKKSIALFRQIIHETLYVLDNQQKRRLIYVFFIIIISSVFELIGVTAILPFVQAVVAPEELMANKYVGAVCEALGVQKSSTILLLVGICIIIVYLLKNAFLIYAQYVKYDYSTNVQKDLAVSMLSSYMSRPYTFFIETNSTVIKSGCNSAINAFYYIIDALIGLITELLTVLLIGIYLVYSDWVTAFGILGLIGLVLLGIIFGFKPIIKRAGKTNKDAVLEKTKALTEAVDGIKDIMVLKRERVFVDTFDEAAEKASKTIKTYNVLSACPDRITEGICVSGIIGIVCLRMVLGDQNMASFIPKLAVFAMAAFKVLPSVGKIANRVNTIVYYRPLQEMVYSNYVAAEKYAAEMKETRLKLSDDADILAREIADNDFTLKFTDVEWIYNNQNEPVLKGFNMLIHKGESVGLIGPSGGGKTTTVDILLGLLKPKYGSVEINGKDIHLLPRAWSKVIGYVPQSVFLIDDTVRANVAFGINDVNDDDDDEIWNALERANLKDFVSSLPNKLDTIVGEKGVKMSGGQRQRIAIARALYNKPLILVLDEATAALDNDSERAVMEAIEDLQGKITLVIVAHRLTTIRKCDKIYEISDGRATEKSKEEIFH